MTDQSDAREALAKILWMHDVSNHAAHTAPEIGALCDSAADTIIAAGWRPPLPAPSDDERETLLNVLDEHGTEERMHDGRWRENWCWCNSGDDFTPEHLADAILAAGFRRYPVPADILSEEGPTRDEYRVAYEAWRTEGRKLHAALLDIWHMAEPSDTSHLTFGDDPAVVVETVRIALAARPAPPLPSPMPDNLDLAALKALAGFDLHMQAGMPSHVILGGYESEQIIAHMKAAGWGPLPAPSDDEREAIAMIVKRTNAKWAGPSMAEFANDPPTRTHYSIADQVLAYLAARRSPVPADTPSDEEIAAAASIALPVSGATQSGTAVQSGRNFRGAERVAFAAGARWALASRPTPPEDVAAVTDEAREWVQEENWESDYEQDGFNRPGTDLIERLADALAARTASESPSGLELPVETPSAVGASEGVTAQHVLELLIEDGELHRAFRCLAPVDAACPGDHLGSSSTTTRPGRATTPRKRDSAAGPRTGFRPSASRMRSRGQIRCSRVSQ